MPEPTKVENISVLETVGAMSVLHLLAILLDLGDEPGVDCVQRYEEDLGDEVERV